MLKNILIYLEPFLKFININKNKLFFSVLGI